MMHVSESVLDVLHAVAMVAQVKGSSPTQREVAHAVGVCMSRARRRIEQLHRWGMLTRTRTRCATLRLTPFGAAVLRRGQAFKFLVPRRCSTCGEVTFKRRCCDDGSLQPMEESNAV